QAAEEAIEDDGLGEREAEPHQALELAAQLGLAGDGLDHRAEDVADAGARARGAGTDAERERDRLAGVHDRRVLDRGGYQETEHAVGFSFVRRLQTEVWHRIASARARSPSRCRW